MAAASDGVINMVPSSGDEQPMDLSRASRKSTRLMPPLIPISLLRSGRHHHRQFPNKDTVGTKRVALPQLISVAKNQTQETVTERLEESTKVDWRDNQASPKRSRLCGEDGWVQSPRLDRARSVPQLNPLPTLQRHKSLSDSRIPVTTAEADAKVREESFPAWRFDSSSEHLVEEDLQRLRFPDNDALIKSSWIYIDYYSQLLHRFQAQEILRRFALQHERDAQDDKVRKHF